MRACRRPAEGYADVGQFGASSESLSRSLRWFRMCSSAETGWTEVFWSATKGESADCRQVGWKGVLRTALEADGWMGGTEGERADRSLLS
jgi:hypothetical protein